jgi:hypothetical protein
MATRLVEDPVLDIREGGTDVDARRALEQGPSDPHRPDDASVWQNDPWRLRRATRPWKRPDK